MDDDALAARLATDLDRWFETLVRAHADRCYSIALRASGDPRDAEEIAQDALVRAYRALGTYDPERIRALRLRPWLTTIVVNLARNRRRARAVRPVEAPLAPLVEAGREPAAAEAEHPVAIVALGARRERLAALLDALPERYRLPVVLRHVEELGYDEVAEVLGRPEGTVKAQVHRGLALLRASIDAATREELSA